MGLGNPGPDYEGTRHNVGFRVVEELAARRSLRFSKQVCRALVAEAPSLLLAEPLTYMNRSGHAVRCLVDHRELAIEDVLVVYDEIHLPLGRLRLRPKGSPAGHRGLESILDALQTDEVARLRLGVGIEAMPGGEELPDFVLSPFGAEEKVPAEEMIRRAADACEAWLEGGAEAAMQKHNG